MERIECDGVLYIGYEDSHSCVKNKEMMLKSTTLPGFEPDQSCLYAWLLLRLNLQVVKQVVCDLKFLLNPHSVHVTLSRNDSLFSSSSSSQHFFLSQSISHLAPHSTTPRYLETPKHFRFSLSLEKITNQSFEMTCVRALVSEISS